MKGVSRTASIGPATIMLKSVFPLTIRCAIEDHHVAFINVFTTTHNRLGYLLMISISLKGGSVHDLIILGTRVEMQ